MLFKYEWYDNTLGVRVIQPHDIMEVNHTTRLASPDFQQVYYMLYPSKCHGQVDSMVACKVQHRCSFNVSEILDTSNTNVYQ